MVLETTMICLDNSDWMRNGDYMPSRLDAQQDSAELLTNDRTRSNPENTVGILAMGGKSGVELLASPTEDRGKLAAAFAKVQIGGRCDFATAVQIAALALKHRKNKNGGQRIIAFIGSPLHEDIDLLKKVAKVLKKNNVAVDVISIGEFEDNEEKLTEFINTINKDENSHLIAVPAGVSPADAIRASPVMGGSGAGPASANAAAGFGFDAAGGDGFDYGGIDPYADPELAAAIRASTEDSRAATASAVASNSGSAGEGADLLYEDDEDALLQRALMLSTLQLTPEHAGNIGSSSSSSSSPNADTANVNESADEEDEDELALRLALEMSVQSDVGLPTAPTSSTLASSSSSSAAAAEVAMPPLPPTASSDSSDFLNPAFVSQLLGSVDVDQNDPLILAALAQLGANTAGAPDHESKGSEEEESKKRKDSDRD